jgi:hypothetical protein
MLLNRLEPMMPAAAAPRAQPDFSDRQVRIIDNHEQAIHRHPVKRHNRPDASPLAFINVSGSHRISLSLFQLAFATRATNFFSRAHRAFQRSAN